MSPLKPLLCCTSSPPTSSVSAFLNALNFCEGNNWFATMFTKQTVSRCKNTSTFVLKTAAYNILRQSQSKEPKIRGQGSPVQVLQKYQFNHFHFFTLLVSAMAAASHADRVSLSLSLLTSSDKPDMSLVSLEGFHLPTYSILLSLHSPYLRSLLSLSSPSSLFSPSSLSSSSSLAISVPLPAQPIASLLNLLVTGDSKQQQSFDPIQVT